MRPRIIDDLMILSSASFNKQIRLEKGALDAAS